MTLQEIFDTVCKGLKAQGFKKSFISTSTEDRCMYRGPEGLKCAAGHLIPDNIYSPGMENKSIISLVNSKRYAFPEYFGVNLDLIHDLQKAHDYSREEDIYTIDSSMQNALRDVGIAYKLNTVVLDAP